MPTVRSLLAETDFSPAEVEALFEAALAWKARRVDPGQRPLDGQTWALLFHKPSTRTRVSFEVGVHELGGNPLFLDQRTTQIGRGESIADTARVLSRYVHGLIVRTHAHAIVEELAAAGSVPVVNALTDLLHPCQIYSDLFTLIERWRVPGRPLLEALRGRKLCFLGDTASNMAHSWILGGVHLGLEVALAGPEHLAPEAALLEHLDAAGLPRDGFTFTTDPHEAAAGADAVYTDVWVSMGDEDEREARLKTLRPYQVDAAVMERARPDACFMHCLPAHEGEEVSAEVYQGPRAIVFDQAENRLHVQKAILAALARSAAVPSP